MKIFLWVLSFLILLALHAVVIGVICSVVNYCFVDIFTIKNYIGIVVLVTVIYFIKDYGKYKNIINKKIKDGGYYG